VRVQSKQARQLLTPCELRCKHTPAGGGAGSGGSCTHRQRAPASAIWMSLTATVSCTSAASAGPRHRSSRCLLPLVSTDKPKTVSQVCAMEGSVHRRMLVKPSSNCNNDSRLSSNNEGYATTRRRHTMCAPVFSHYLFSQSLSQSVSLSVGMSSIHPFSRPLFPL
jgi:hypothetical protein